MLKAAAAVQAVLLPDGVGLPRRDAALGAVGRAGAAADAAFGDLIAFRRSLAAAEGIGLAEDGVHAQVKVFDGTAADGKHDADVPGIAGVDVGQIGLLGKDGLDPASLFLLGHRLGSSGQADHLFIAGVAQHLHPAVGQQLAAEVNQAAQIVTDNLHGIQYIQQNADTITAVAQNSENITAVGENIGNVNSVAQNLTPIQTAATNISGIQAAPTAASNAAASATLAESWAVGGTGTRPGENTNNAEYWAQQAQAVAQGQLGWYATPQELQSAHPSGQNGQWAIIGTTDTIWTWDSDTSAWVNSGAQVDLSNYYTKAQADSEFAPKSHASTLTTYGTGSSAVYGHVKLSDTPGTSGVYDGTAATPKCVQDAVASLSTTKIVLLWTNSSPSSTFPAKKVSLSLSGYHAVLVLGWSYSAEAVCSSILVPVGSKGVITLVGTGTAYRNFSTSSSGVTFEAASVENTATPYKIYGIKL